MTSRSEPCAVSLRCVFFGICLIATLGLTACSTTMELGVRHRATGLNSRFNADGLPYDVYVATMRNVIAQTRVDLQSERRETIVDWNSPFILEPDLATCPRPVSGRYRNGIVLVHGLTDSPFQMHDLANYFQRKCFVVVGLLLPGHGTVPGDLLEVRYEDWVKATAYAAASLKTRVDRFFIGGASTGATLALHSALAGERPAALVLLAPVIKLRASRVSVSKVLRIAFDFRESRRWATISAEEDPAKYESFPVNAAYQIWRLTRRLTALPYDRDPNPTRWRARTTFASASSRSLTSRIAACSGGRAATKALNCDITSVSPMMGEPRPQITSSRCAYAASPWNSVRLGGTIVPRSTNVISRRQVRHTTPPAAARRWPGAD